MLARRSSPYRCPSGVVATVVLGLALTVGLALALPPGLPLSGPLTGLTTTVTNVCDVSAPPYSAKPDNHTDNTVSLQAALSDRRCTVVLVPPKGIFLARALSLEAMSHRTLKIEPNAVLGIYGNPATYGSTNAFLFAATTLLNVTLGGGGSIQGFGPAWWAYCKVLPEYCFRPKSVSLTDVDGLTISGLTILDSPSWNFALRGANILVEGVTSLANVGSCEGYYSAPNTDGASPNE